jgi:signal transduction histidine kinase
MNFKSLETERKRIANDLHDQIGYKMTIINKSIDTMAQKLNIQSNEEIEIAIHSIMYQFLRILNKFSIIYAAKIG